MTRGEWCFRTGRDSSSGLASTRKAPLPPDAGIETTFKPEDREAEYRFYALVQCPTALVGRVQTVPGSRQQKAQKQLARQLTAESNCRKAEIRLQMGVALGIDFVSCCLAPSLKLKRVTRDVLPQPFHSLRFDSARPDGETARRAASGPSHPPSRLLSCPVQRLPCLPCFDRVLVCRTCIDLPP